MRSFDRKVAIGLALCLGFALRAITPAGYMPGALEGGFWFELCPEQLPAGMSLAGSGSSAHHHHGDDAGTSQSEADQCRIGHLLSSGIAIGTFAPLDVALPRPTELSIDPAPGRLGRPDPVFQSRGPPPPAAREL